jgi:hypothetical protein
MRLGHEKLDANAGDQARQEEQRVMMNRPQHLLEGNTGRKKKKKKRRR